MVGDPLEKAAILVWLPHDVSPHKVSYDPYLDAPPENAPTDNPLACWRLKTALEAVRNSEPTHIRPWIKIGNSILSYQEAEQAGGDNV